MTLQIKDLGVQDYIQTYNAMRDFNNKRDSGTVDQIWLLEHPPVYTLGLSDKTEHLLNTADIPVIKTDRGGQVTFHGPGQLIAYLLIDLNRRPYAIKKLVSLMETSVIEYLIDCGVKAGRKSGAPGVYVHGQKIAALGVRVRKGGTYHGLALNINMDLKPFEGINPCGYEGMVCTQLIQYKKDITLAEVKMNFPVYLLKYLDKSSGVLSDVA
ncbi:MAG: lipoyl(octanoyl) transferase LipB [Proteobacteria bacterium]|nr:lipoyl(octanoyl) transferase LipB [Pseudomonadota bacterium]